MKNKLPTAYQFLQSESLVDSYGKPNKLIEQAMIKFGRLCAKAALEEVAEEVKKIYEGNGLTNTGERAHRIILKSFNFEQIK